MKASRLVSVSIAALIAHSAQAQDAQHGAPASSKPVTDGAALTVAQSGGAAPAGQQASDTGLQDIIVTATKVETVLQRTPQAITTISGAALVKAGVATVQDLNKLVPGLIIEQNGSAASIFIRGIGTRVLGPTNDPAVAFSVDGVYYDRAVGTTTNFFDLDRVEVVKGPQGTLYGRNATGGAINLVTRRPRLGERTLDGEIEVGDYNSVRATAGVNLPLGDRAALRLSGQTVYNSGYLSDGYNDTNTKAGRASLLFQPSDALSIFASGDYSTQGGQGAGVVILGPSVGNNSLNRRFVVPGDPFVGPSDPRSNAVLAAAIPVQGVPGPGPGVYCPGAVVGPPTPGGIPAMPLCSYPFGVPPIAADGFVRNEFYGGNLTVNADVGVADITAIGGYRKSKQNTLQRVDYGRQLLIADVDQYSGELRIASPAHSSSRLKWLVGAFYLHEKQAADTLVSMGNQVIPVPGSVCATAPMNGICLTRPILVQDATHIIDPDLTDATYAGFGQATVSLTRWLRLTGGIRYTHERKAEVNGQVTSIYTIPAGLMPTYISQGAVKFHDTSYRAGLEIDIAPRSMLYATYSTAFHAGGFNLGVAQGPNRYGYSPEHVKSYVVGVKNRFFENRLQLNVEGFWNDYENYQQSSLGYINDGSTACSVLMIQRACPLSLRTDNAAQARVRGVEGEVVLRIGKGGTLSGDILYNDARFRSFNIVSPFTNVVTSYAGVTLPDVTPWTLTGEYSQDFALANGGKIVFTAHTIYHNGAYSWFQRYASQYERAYTRTDLTLGYELPGKHLRITAFVRNVEDDATANQGNPLNAATGLRFTNLNPPRTFGAILGFDF